MTPATVTSIRPVFVFGLPATVRTARTCRLRHTTLASGTGLAMRSLRLMVTSWRFS